MPADTALPPNNTHNSQPNALERFEAVVDSGFLGVGVPSHMGGQGGNLEDLFTDQAAIRWLQGQQDPDLQIFQSQRLVIEALVRSENIALREFHLPELLAGNLAGASTLACSPVEAKTQGLGWKFHGQLKDVPNLQWLGYSLLIPVQTAGEVKGVLLVRSEESGVSARPGDGPLRWHVAAHGDVHFNQVFLRADEWLGDPPLWVELLEVHRRFRDGVRNTTHR
ncbi:hypothetical protein [Hydrogenophaga sp. OTU3427]|uniref:hypothetical protein n=1 Tax=Hydrogenophaga sp. OTU3427 TaxID=3043856 RepID=UPI00313E7A26